MLDNFRTAPINKFKKINKILKRQFGVTLKEDIDIKSLNDIKEHVSKSIFNLKISGKISMRDSELSKNLLIMEGIDSIIEHKKLNEYAGHMGHRFRKVIDWLVDYAFKNIELGDDFEEALSEALKQYRSSKYRFDDMDIGEQVRNGLMQKLKQVQMDEGDGDISGGLPMEEQDPWSISNVNSGPDNVEQSKELDPVLLSKIRGRYTNESREKVTEMRRDYVKELRRLLEDEVDQAEVLVAAKGFSQELQEIIQKIGRMQNEDLGPVIDQMRQAYGAEVAMNFQRSMHGELDQILGELRQAKGQIDDAVDGMATGGGMMPDNDMAMDAGMEPEMGDDLGMDPMGGGEMDAEMGMEPEMGDELGGADAAAMGDEPLGRAAKESKTVFLKNKILEMEKAVKKMKKVKESRRAKK